MNRIYPIIMAGGTGSRLWPLSRESYPKQFIRLYGKDSMLQATIKRLNGLNNITEPLIICNEEHRFIAAEQLREINQLAHNIILEPFGRNTAPAVALAAIQIAKQDPEGILLVLAADHVINNESAFYTAINNALLHAKDNKLVTFGIVPNYPETGYGYIKKGQSYGDNAFVVDQFVEKPDLLTATEYLSSGQFLWNSGLFMFKAVTYLDELKKYSPNILACCQAALSNTSFDLDFVRLDKEEFSQCPSDSIDYAVMEHTADAVVVPMDANWNDVGSWSSLWDISQKDNNNNVLNGDVIAINSTNNYIRSESKLVTTVGVSDLVIVETKDAVLVMNKDECQQVKQVIEQLKLTNRHEHQIHREVYRPWGKFDLIDQGTRYKVRSTSVKPGGKISLQIHHHRSEHLVVVAGTAKVCIGNDEHIITENQSIYIPLGIKHSIDNIGRIKLELIEIHSGSYLEEDDIVRLEDHYNKNNKGENHDKR